jgi:hypothetical protein
MGNEEFQTVVIDRDQLAGRVAALRMAKIAKKQSRGFGRLNGAELDAIGLPLPTPPPWCKHSAAERVRRTEFTEIVDYMDRTPAIGTVVQCWYPPPLADHAPLHGKTGMVVILPVKPHCMLRGKSRTGLDGQAQHRNIAIVVDCRLHLIPRPYLRRPRP